MSTPLINQTSKAVNEILQVERGHVEAFNIPDLDKVLSYFAENINGFSSTHNNRYKGREALRKTFEYYLQKSKRIYYEIQDIEVQMLKGGEAAIATFYWKTAPLEGTEEDIITGRGTHVLEYQNGQWRIVHEHFSRAH
jgi:ketosteroid isomerase-like protein